MPDLSEGASVEIQGSARLPYVLKNVAGVYSCNCPAWRNQSLPIERRSCKHLKRYRGVEAERMRVGEAAATSAPETKAVVKAPTLLLAQSWSCDIDPAGWWLSEKLDGVRAYWDGSCFWSRQGNVYHAPDWFVASLPNVPLDGELWLARKAFQRTVSIVRRHDRSDHWREIRYLVFDAPAQNDSFERRLDFLRETLAGQPKPHVRVHEHERCRDVEHLRTELARVESLGGEGLMLRQAGSRYEPYRSATLLKVKTFHDADACVVEHLPGAGRHAGRLGALLVELPNGKRFSVGTGLSDAERNTPPPVGSTITFRYQELTDSGVPRFPSFVRIAGDADLPLLAEANATSSTANRQRNRRL